MKRITRFAMIVTVLLVFVLATFLPMSVSASPPGGATVPIDVISVVVTIVLGFASLIGISALVAALVNLLKVIKVVQDGTSAQWAAGLNLAAFIALVAFGVFRPDLTMDILSGYAGQIATVVLFLLGFITQITGSKTVHDQLVEARIPLIGKSYSVIKDA